MGTPVPLVLPVRGDLDTSMPVTDRPLGGLVRARDLHPRRWGPRDGCQSFARVWQGPGTASLYDTIDLTTGASTYGTGASFEDQFRDLGTKWTLDVWFRLTSTAYASTKDKIGLYKFIVNSSGVIELSINGPTHATHPGRLHAYIITNPSAGSADTPVELNGNAVFSVGSTQADKHHARLVRDGASLAIYVDGVADTSTSSLVATSGLVAAPGTAALVGLGNVYIASDITVTTKGTIYGAWLRDGAFTSLPIEAQMPCAPHARNVHHAYLGRNISLGGVDHFFDASRFGAHARISGAGYTVTASNDDTAPAPATIQGLTSWNTRGNRTATAVVCGGQLSLKGVS